MKMAVLAFSLFVGGYTLFHAVIPTALAQTGSPEPGGNQQSSDLATSNPDEYAWQLFEFLTRQAAPGGAGTADPRKPLGNYDPDHPTVFETWALSSGDGLTQNGSEVYKQDGSEPSEWTALLRDQPIKVFSANLKSAAVMQERALQRLQQSPLGRMQTVQQNMDAVILIAPLNPDQDFEVRMNRAAFDFVRTNELYNVEGLESQLAKARNTGNREAIQLPPMAKEIKADWIPAHDPSSVSADEKARYHWRKVGGKFYLLVALHITTKDLKNWFWADFAQEDFETQPGPALPSIDSTTRGQAATHRGSKDGIRGEYENTKWAHYRLRGTQINFVKSDNSPVIIGNTQIEIGFADKSSCMTCHFRASVGDGVNRRGTVNSLSAGVESVGVPLQDQFGAGSQVSFLSTDFVWSAPFRARHRQ